MNTRYTHTPGTPKKCAEIVIAPASDNLDTGTYEPVLRYRHTYACIKGISGTHVPVSCICMGFFLLGFFFGFFLGYFFGFFLGYFFGFFFGFFLGFLFLGFFLGECDDLRITSPNAYFRCGIPRLGRGASPCFSEKVLCVSNWGRVACRTAGCNVLL